jgi:hypothetical protein
VCVLFNLAKEYHEKLEKGSESKKNSKTSDALCRSTIVTACYVIEAYLNGIAFDYYWANSSQLSDKKKILLTEWDHVEGRSRHISLREKALQYPRIIMGANHPPLQESNCPELAFVLERAKLMRDSIVHATPKLDFNTFEAEKEREIYAIELKDVELTINNCIVLIEKFEMAIRNNTDRLWWLHHPESNGYFSESVFS